MKKRKGNKEIILKEKKKIEGKKEKERITLKEKEVRKRR